MTYTIGRVTSPEPQIILAEIATDVKRELAISHLKGIEEELPVVMESIGWGWIASTASVKLPATTSPDLNRDPLVLMEAPNGPETFLLSKKVFWFRYLFWLSLTVILIFLLIGGGYFSHPSPVLAGIYLIVFLLWLYSMGEVSFDIRLYGEKIACGPIGLDVTYWFRRKAVRLLWKEIKEMEYTNSVCVINCQEGPVRFLISERSGCKEKMVILKTIVQRASLNYVEGDFRKSVYKRYEAP